MIAKKAGVFAMLLMGSSIFSIAQNVKDSILAVPLIQTSFAYQFPGADLADRFGVNMNVGLDFMYKTDGNWLWGVGGNFLFGDDIKEDNILDGLRTENGNIIDQNGAIAEVTCMKEAGRYWRNSGNYYPLWAPIKTRACC